MALETGVGSCPWQSVLVLLNEGLGGGGGGVPGGPGAWYSCKLGEVTMAGSTVLQDAPWPGTSQGGAVKAPTRDPVSRVPPHKPCLSK